MEHLVYYDIAAAFVLLTALVAYHLRKYSDNFQSRVYRVMLYALLVVSTSDFLLFWEEITFGKTGTTNNNIDAWFCGYSPSIQTLVWFGNDNNTPMKRTETGGKIAAPVFGNFYKKYLELHPEIPRTFTMPQNVYTSNINGKTELFTDKSPLPEIDILVQPSSPGEEVLEF